MSQTEFGEKIGMSSAAVSRWESGERKIPDVVVLSICREFNVSEPWLRDGVGPMRPDRGRAEELGELVNSLLADRPGSFRSALVTTLLRFDPEGPQWEILERIYQDISKEVDRYAPPEEPPAD